MISRIVITADLLRPFARGQEWESATWKNVRWLHHVLSPALHACGVEPETLSWDDRCPGGRHHFFDTPAIYHRQGLALEPGNWARLAQSTTAPQALVQALDAATQGALVIGYEMPPVMLDILQQLERPYVDVVLHPWRFLPDLVFALRSNRPALQTQIEAQRLPAALAVQQAALIQAKAAWMSPPCELPPGTALLLGQVAGDRAAALPDGRFASLGDHLHRLHQICTEHPLVLYKPHPYAGPNDRSTEAVASLPAIRVVDHNFYHLLAQPELDTVVALNSSGLVEARAFGRRSHNLIPWLYDFEAATPPAPGQPAAPVPLDSRWTQAGFWQPLLLDRPEAGDTAPTPCLPPQTLRRAMNADWGYHFIEQVCA